MHGWVRARPVDGGTPSRKPSLTEVGPNVYIYKSIDRYISIYIYAMLYISVYII